MQSGCRPAGDIAALAAMLAPIDRGALVVVLDRNSPVALTAPDSTRQQILADPSAGWVSSLGRVDETRCHERLMDPREPIVTSTCKPEIDPVAADLPHRRVLDSG